MDSEDIIDDNIDNIDDNIETEDLNISDAEDNAYGDKKYDPLNIDYNSRVVAEQTSITCHERDNCDMQFKKSRDNLFIRKTEEVFNTSSDELEVSDEDIHSSTSSVQHVDLKGHAITSNKKYLDSYASKKYSKMARKKDYDTDAEYISEDELIPLFENESGNTVRFRKLSSGLSIAQIISVEQPEQLINSVDSEAITPTVPSIFVGDKNMYDLSEVPDAPLMTCLEFLKSDVSEDDGTDVEDISTDSLCDGKELVDLKTCGINEMLGLELNDLPFVVADPVNNGTVPCSVPFLRNRRRSSAAEFLTEDETLFFENDVQYTNRKRTKRYIYKQQLDNSEHTDDSLTDEELLDVKSKEWTETDESGGMRQITQIKTETSIKLEGNGADSILEGDDLISRTTATTTTRIVTTVVGGDGEESRNEQVIEDGDDLRHSVEVILNQFMSDDTPNAAADDSKIEQDE